MPYRYELTWSHHANRWRKRYLGQTYYLKTAVNGKRDRPGYLAAWREWERLKACIDGLGPSPYTETGALIPESQLLNVAPVYIPPAPTPVLANGHASEPPINGRQRKPILPQPLKPPGTPSWIQGYGVLSGLHPELIVNPKDNPYLGERKIHVLAKYWRDQRRKLADRGELSLKQWAEDKAKLQVFQKFMLVNYPQVTLIDELDATMLNLYRDTQWELVDSDGESSISKITLKKRLDTVAKWLTWLVDQNILAELPKDLRKYGQVKLDKPKPLFWSVEEVKLLASKASERTRLYILLALNLGYTQKDIATLQPEMIDWETGIVTRDRLKTGVPSQGKLWPETLALLKKHSGQGKGPILRNENGTPLYVEKVNKNGKLIISDAIRLAFNRLKGAKKTGLKGDSRSFKHFRKTAANEIEKVRPDLTGLFLAHAESGMKRHYAKQHFEELFNETDRLAELFGFVGVQSIGV